MNGKITALKIQKRNPRRVNIFLDGEFAFGLSRLTAAWLRIGQELDAEKINELQAADQYEAAYQRALHFLSYRPRSESEVRRNLQKHDLPPEVIRSALERLRKNGLVNDLQFAQTWIENRSEFRPRGRRSLKMELRQKGIADASIEDVLQNLDEDELAYKAALKQFSKYRSLEWQDYRRKMSAFLARRGFNYEAATLAMKRVWDDERRNLSPGDNLRG
jgi:regulatory protein